MNYKIKPRLLFDKYKKTESWKNVDKSHENLFTIGAQSILFRMDTITSDFLKQNPNIEKEKIAEELQKWIFKNILC